VAQHENFDDDETFLDVNMNQNRPSEQLKLTDLQLNENMPTKMLSDKNPRAPRNITCYSYQQRRFLVNELPEQLQLHFELEGDIILKNSNDGNI